MSRQISSLAEADASRAEIETAIPIVRQEAFWSVRRIGPSGYVEHLPFLFCIVGALRPRVAVTIGVGDGTAHFAVCQAIDRLDLGGTCLGLDRWGADGPSEAIAAYGGDHYGEISRLRAADDVEGAVLLGPGAVDLLVVDRALEDVPLAELAEAWLPRLSPHGALVLRGLGQAPPDSPARAALAALRERRPSFELPHGDGLAVLAAGEDMPPGLARLTGLAAQPALLRTVQQVFRRLGLACRHELAAHGATAALAESRQALEAAQAGEAETARHLAEARRKLQARETAYGERHRQVARFQAEIADLRAEVDAARTRADEIEARSGAQLGVARAETEAAHARAAEAAKARDRALLERARIEDDLLRRFDEITVLTKMLEARDGSGSEDLDLTTRAADALEAVLRENARLAQASKAGRST